MYLKLIIISAIAVIGQIKTYGMVTPFQVAKLKPFIFYSCHTDFLKVNPYFTTNYRMSGSSKLMGQSVVSKKYNQLDYNYDFNIDMRIGFGLQLNYPKNKISLSYSTILNQYYNFYGTPKNERKEQNYNLFSDSQIYTIGFSRNITDHLGLIMDLGTSLNYEYFKSPESISIRQANFNIPSFWSEKYESLTFSIIPRVSYPIYQQLTLQLKCYPYLTIFKSSPFVTTRSSSGHFIHYRLMIEINYNIFNNK